MTVFVVMHAGAASFLPEILELAWQASRGNRPAGRFHRPWTHLCCAAGPPYVGRGTAHKVEQGPRVHGVRPAIDPMFASVAGAYGRRVMVIVLTAPAAMARPGSSRSKTGRLCARPGSTAGEVTVHAPGSPRGRFARITVDRGHAVRVIEFCSYPWVFQSSIPEQIHAVASLSGRAKTISLGHGPPHVFLGAGIGGVLRQLINVAAAQLGGAMPIGTLAINVAGSFAMGVITIFRDPRPTAAALATFPDHQHSRRLHDLLGLLARGCSRSMSVASLPPRRARRGLGGTLIGALVAALALVRTLMRK